MAKKKIESKLKSWWAIFIYGAVGSYLLTHLGDWLSEKIPKLNFPIYLLSGLIIFIVALFLWEIGVRFMNIHDLVQENNAKLKKIEKELKGKK